MSLLFKRNTANPKFNNIITVVERLKEINHLYYITQKLSVGLSITYIIYTILYINFNVYFIGSKYNKIM